MKRNANYLVLGKLLLVFVLAVGTLLWVGCSGETEKTPVGPVTPVIPDCERYNTATVTFANESSHSTYDVILDGSKIGSVSPGHSITKTLAAGQHTYRFIFSNTGRTACREAEPNLATCQNSIFSCSGDY